MPIVTLEQEASSPLSFRGLDDALPPPPYPYELNGKIFYLSTVPTDSCDDFVPSPYTAAQLRESLTCSLCGPSCKPLESQTCSRSGPSYNPSAQKPLESQTCSRSGPSYTPSESFVPSPLTHEPTSNSCHDMKFSPPIYSPQPNYSPPPYYGVTRFPPPLPTSLVPLMGYDWLLGQVGLHCYNLQNGPPVWGKPFELRKVVVQTREHVESKKKAKAENAIFYISFKTSDGQDGRAIIRRTTDGMPQHMSLEVKCLM